MIQVVVAFMQVFWPPDPQFSLCLLRSLWDRWDSRACAPVQKKKKHLAISHWRATRKIQADLQDLRAPSENADGKISATEIAVRFVCLGRSTAR